MVARRQSSLLALKRIRSQTDSYEETEILVGKRGEKPLSRPSSSKRVSSPQKDASDAGRAPHQPSERPVKRLKRTAPKRAAPASHLYHHLFSAADSENGTRESMCRFPSRQHGLDYHRPLLLRDKPGKHGRTALLEWYDQVSTDRSMPWRKPFVDPKDYLDPTELREVVTQRAYEVFISEIMLQQTRVKVVIDYWNRWMDKWPTIYDLANAEEDDVMSAWRGLGYYSRCKRILEACRKIVNHPHWRGRMPDDAKTLEKEIPGVGPYTAGAISSIVFGRPAAMVDGNVLRVLSRQLGLLGDTKTDKTIIDLIWSCASALVETVSLDAAADGEEVGEVQPNSAPGRWGQALMELGSTICTPSPNCSACPVTTTCRAYEEGMMLAEARGSCQRSASKLSEPIEIEDLCQLCEPFPAVAMNEPVEKVAAKNTKQAKLSSFFSSNSTDASRANSHRVSQTRSSPSSEALNIVASHAQKFPVKVVKKALREQETLVCAIQRPGDEMYLLQKRPEKGLLAGMWEFPSHILPEANDSTSASRKRTARDFVTSLFSRKHAAGTVERQNLGLEYIGELGSVPWVFSHLKLMMHVHLFRLNTGTDIPLAEDPRRRRWATPEAVEGETMGTGMRQCWKLIETAA